MSQPVPDVDNAKLEFLTRMARALHRYGATAYRLETALSLLAQRLGLEAHIYATPTSILVAVGDDRDQRIRLVRVDPGDTDLDKLRGLQKLLQNVSEGSVPIVEGTRALDALLARPPLYGNALRTLAFPAVSAASARLLGGAWREMAVAAAIGLVIGVLSLWAARREALARVFILAASLCASYLAFAAATVIAPLAVVPTMVAGVVVLLPGLTLTQALTELATRHLASGTARLFGAVAVFLMMAVGIAIGSTIASAEFRVPPPIEAAAIAEWTRWLALAVSLLGAAILFRARQDELGFVLAAGFASYLSALVGALVLQPKLGVFCGTFVLVVLSGAYARWRDRPAATLYVTGVLPLVPGSFGFSSLSALMARDAATGMQAGFDMAFIAAALAAGFLVANLVLPPRRFL